MQFPLCFRASVVKLNLMSQAIAGNCSIGPSKRLLTWLPRPTPPVDFAAVAAVTTPAAEAVFMPEIPRSTPHVKALVGLDLANADSRSAASCRWTILRPRQTLFYSIYRKLHAYGQPQEPESPISVLCDESQFCVRTNSNLSQLQRRDRLSVVNPPDFAAPVHRQVLPRQ